MAQHSWEYPASNPGASSCLRSVREELTWPPLPQIPPEEFKTEAEGALVGEPVIVNVDVASAAARPTAVDDGRKPRAWWALQCAGYWCIILDIPALLEVLWDADIETFRVMRLMRVANIISLCCVFWLLRRSHRTDALVPHGCECLVGGERLKFLPRSLIVVSVLQFGADACDMVSLGKDGIKPAGIFAIVALLFMALKLESSRLWFHSLQHRDLLSSSKSEVARLARIRSSKERFIVRMSHESRKFELIYVAVETFLVGFAIASRLSSGFSLPSSPHFPIQLGIVVAPACLLLRIYRCCILRSRWNVGTLGTLLDSISFTWYAILAGFAGSGPVHLVSSFFIDKMLSYMLIFVFPFRRALVVIPLCYIGYGVGLYLTWDARDETNGIYPKGEFILLGIGLCISLAAKRIIERSKWQAFLMLEEQTEKFVQEKVLRFQAEFQREVATGRFEQKNEGEEASAYLGLEREHTVRQPGHPAQTLDHCKMSEHHAGQGKRSALAPASLRSAPALLSGGASHVHRDALKPLSPGCHAGDCLPPDALAWVEGDAIPRPLAKLEAGNRVLCFDRLGGSLKHAELTEVKLIDGATEWTTICLEDGTQLEVTADHPVQPTPPIGESWGPYGAAPLPAAQLKPGRDCLLVLKVVPVPVRSITERWGTSSHVSVTVQQCERHSIFISSPGQRGVIRTIAVESANAFSHRLPTLQTKGTFVNVADDQCSSLEKPFSAPPSFCHVPENITVEAHPSGCSGESSQSSCSFGGGAGDVQVCLRPTDLREAAGAGAQKQVSSNGSVSLRQMLQTHALGWRSAGSSTHSHGDCKVCAHENKRQHQNTQPCINGAYCNFCHEDHANQRQNRHVNRRQFKRNERRTEAADITDG